MYFDEYALPTPIVARVRRRDFVVLWQGLGGSVTSAVFNPCAPWCVLMASLIGEGVTSAGEPVQSFGDPDIATKNIPGAVLLTVYRLP